ncbi:MAG: formylglycine-generating enzyme family protein [Deltaproteobacteria bacterium]|nr:formylglycine-generating enzyme family protein [Deltaproteobacteria bacterium]
MSLIGLSACALVTGCIQVDRDRTPVDDSGSATDTTTGEVDVATPSDTAAEAEVSPPECGEASACPEPSAPCAEAACDDGRCVVRQREPGSACDDGEPCTGDGQCAGDVCQRGAALEDGADCDDGLLCNGVGTCAQGECVVAIAGACPQLGGPCIDRWECSEELEGACAPVPAEDGTTCKSDEVDGECSAGRCVPRDMIWIPRGVFIMGCDTGPLCPLDARPAHDVRLSGFAIDRTEVTEQAWRACVDANKCAPRPNEDQIVPRDKDEPVRELSWLSAVDVCVAQGKRLCTEAEWEKAARGADAERNFPWGNTLATCERAVFHDLGVGAGCGAGGPAEVGGREAGASPYGALDMAGNVAEWVLDAYVAEAYLGRVAGTPDNPMTDPASAGETGRVMRGGGWATLVDGLRVFKRAAQPLTFTDDEVGVRCCWGRAEDDVEPGGSGSGGSGSGGSR